ncbi:MAG: cupin domain-containing protein [Dehalococcoidia bacterium]
MSVFHLRDFNDVPNRPGRRVRDLAGSIHGFDSVFVTENEVDHGSAIPLHTHPVEEGWIVLEGELSVRIGDKWVTVPAGSVARVPPGVAHAVKNEAEATAKAITTAPWNRDTFHAEATTYIDEG